MHPFRKIREEGGGVEQVASALAPDVVFNSPILSRPVVGRDLAARVMVAAAALRDGRYVSEMTDGSVTMMHWKGMIFGQPIETLEVLRSNADGLVVERTVAIRPFSALLLFRREFRKRMESELGDAYFALPPDELGEFNPPSS